MCYQDVVTASVTYTEQNTIVKYVIGSTTVTYTLDAKYEVINFGKIGSTTLTEDNNTASIPDSSDGATISLNPSVKKKQYNPNFK